MRYGDSDVKEQRSERVFILKRMAAIFKMRLAQSWIFATGKRRNDSRSISPLLRGRRAFMVQFLPLTSKIDRASWAT